MREDDVIVTATASVTGPHKVGSVLRLLEAALAEEREEAAQLVRELWDQVQVRPPHPETYRGLRDRVGQFLRQFPYHPPASRRAGCCDD